MIKITIIAWLVFIILKIVGNIMAESMSPEEKAIYVVNGRLPFRMCILGCVIGLEFIISVILTVITIIKW